MDRLASIRVKVQVSSTSTHQQTRPEDKKTSESDVTWQFKPPLLESLVYCLLFVFMMLLSFLHVSINENIFVGTLTHVCYKVFTALVRLLQLWKTQHFPRYIACPTAPTRNEPLHRLVRRTTTCHQLLDLRPNPMLDHRRHSGQREIITVLWSTNNGWRLEGGYHLIGRVTYGSESGSSFTISSCE